MVDLLEVGRIDRPHGVRGDVVVSLTTNRTERVAPGAVLHCATGELTVSASRPHQGRFIVTFDGIRDRNEAEAAKGQTLRAAPLDDPDELWVHELIGLSVIDQLGVDRGRIVGVVENPASDLLELDRGALVPVRFVVGRPADGHVVVEAPDGLFDLDDDGPDATAADAGS